MNTFTPRTALVHDWLPVYAGAERVLEQIIRVVPDSEVHTLVDFIPDEKRHFLQGRSVHTSFIQRLPFAEKLYRHYLMLCPLAIEGFDLSDYEAVVSSNYAVAKGVLTSTGQLHVSYVHTPIRYAWDLHFQYLQQGGYESGLKRLIARVVLHYLRLYDFSTASRPDLLVANSHFVARRIWETYRRPATVVHPPVDVDKFTLQREKEDHYVTVSRFVPFKRVDVLVKAFSQMPDRTLLVIGDGPERAKLEKQATSNIKFLGYQSGDDIIEPLQNARAFVYAGIEDFGIAPVEAQACGTPVIAYGKGGVLETIRPGETGLFFDQQTPGAVCQAVRKFEKEHFEPEVIRLNAERFSAERFRTEFANLLNVAWDQFQNMKAMTPLTGAVLDRLTTNGNEMPSRVKA